MRFYTDEIQFPFRNDFPEAVIGTDLQLQLFRRKPLAVILYGSHILRKPGESFFHLFFFHKLPGPYDIILFYIFHINTELLLPLFHIGNRCIHSERPSPEIPEGCPF